MIAGLFLLGSPASAAEGIDLNRASAAELDTLPGIGPTKASALVAWRAEHGPCRTLDDLIEAPGIGEATIGMLRGRAYCGRAEPPAAPQGERSPAIRPVDINRAGVEELMRLPGVVEVRAKAIVADRARNGPFGSCAELLRVPGIGPATIANLGSGCVAR